MTTVNSPIPLEPITPYRGSPVDDFVGRLSHPVPGHAGGAVATAIQSLLSFGMLPLLIWPTRWAEFLETERHDLIDLAGWWRRRVDSSDAAKLDKIVKRLRPRPILMVLPWLAVGFNGVLMVLLLVMGDDLSRLWNLTFDHRVRSIVSHGTPQSELESHLYWTWISTLCAAYALQWHAVRSHFTAVNALVKWTNKISRENHFRYIPMDLMHSGFNAVWWILLAIALSLHQAWWAIPLACAGSLQRNYIRKVSPTVRMAFASQARSAFAVARSNPDRFCAAGHCGARLPSPARFCPRCGTAV